jgi:hypothetical protein
LSLLELLLALTITVMVSAAIAAMLGAVSSGVGSRRDTRSVMVLASAAQTRLSAYIVLSRCILNVEGANMVLWVNDDRPGGTVHATELRWLKFDPAAGAINVSFVRFPAGWSQAACDLEDQEYPSTANWESVLASYTASGWVKTQPLVDQLVGVTITTDQPLATASRHVMFRLDVEADEAPVPITAAASIREHALPQG